MRSSLVRFSVVTYEAIILLGRNYSLFSALVHVETSQEENKNQKGLLEKLRELTHPAAKGPTPFPGSLSFVSLFDKGGKGARDWKRGKKRTLHGLRNRF